jgi:glycosyltransferase involved in cell wall biosynthesis
MKIALIYRVDYDDPKTLGVQNKQMDQQSAFIELGLECDAYYHRKGKIIRRGVDNKESVIATLTYKRNRFNLKDFFSELANQIVVSSYNKFYIRYPIATGSFLKFLKQQKTFTVIEVPTYPFKAEWVGLQRLYLPVANYFQSQLKKYCQHLVHFGEEKELFGIPTINIANGINPEKYPLSIGSKSEGLKMIAVGNFGYWHGLDRLIEGMAMSADKNIKLKIVGEGSIIPDWKELVSKHKLDKQVEFYPFTNGEELDQLFNQADIGIGTLAIHRKGVKINSSIKHREYVARGLPFVYAGEDKDFVDCDFALRVEESEEIISVDKLMQWRETLRVSVNRISEYANNKLSWTSKLSTVVEKWKMV